MIKIKNFSIQNIVLFIVSAVAGVLMYGVALSEVSVLSPGLFQLLRVACILFAAYILFERLFEMPLYMKIIIGMVIGAVVGSFFGKSVSEMKPIGEAFIRGIQMIVVPLVFASLIVGTASLGDLKKMKRIGTKTLLYYLCSTAIAITVGLVLANILQPGSDMPDEIKTQLLQNYSDTAGEKIGNAQQNTSAVKTFLNMIPKNPFAALGAASMLQIIFFSIISGIALTMIPKEKAEPVIAFFDGINDAMIKIVLLVIEVAPYGVLALIADAVGSFGLDILSTLLGYTITVTLGLLIMIAIYPFVVSAFTRMSPVKFLSGISLAQLTAFSTSSSGATLPVTMEVCEDNLGVSKEISSFVLPLGATVNMDGTALYQGVAAFFIANVYGIPLDIGAQLTIVLTATLASIGTAAAPGVGILMLVIVLQQIGIPLEGIALILAVDRILDMIRTAVNVTSDAAAASIIAGTEGQLNKGTN